MFGRKAGSISHPGRVNRDRRTGLRRLARQVATHDPLQPAEAPTAEFERAWKLTVKQRVVLIVAFIGAWVVGIEARLVHLQVLLHDDYTARARSQQKALIPLEAGRGDITDRNGWMLAYSVESESITADPSLITDPKKTVSALCTALADCRPKERETLVDRLSADRRFAWVRRTKDVTPEQIARVRALELTGILFETDNRRYHPLVETAAHVVGSVGADNEGQAGIEFSFNGLISGIDGRATADVDRNRQRLRTRVERAPVPGASLELTIDVTLQHIAERELEAGVKAHRATGGTALIMDPNTGEVLALANYPTFNPNSANLSSDDARRNRALQDIYEPGSTFKIVTASAAIEEGVLRPDDLIDTSPGSIVIGRRKPIRDTHSYGILSFEDVIVKSSNVGAIKAGLRVGSERLARYVQRFGFGQTLAPQLTGESRGIWSSQLNESHLASVSMGYEIGVTPLQMVTAVSAVANGGKLLEPHFVRAVIRPGGKERIPTHVLREAITPATAATITTMMEGVVQRGTATAAQLHGYSVAGKTGTAKKAVPGGYSSTDYNASFVGFLPSRAPRFAILVVIDTPRTGSYYGGVVAAPIFQKIAAAAVQYAGLPPSADSQPPLIMRPAPPATNIRQVMATTPGTLTPAGGPSLMPDLIGLPAREAVRVLTTVGLTPRLAGTGFVVSQYPPAGAPLLSGGVGRLELRRLLASGGRNEP